MGPWNPHFNNCPCDSCAHLRVNRPGPTVMLNSAVGRAGTLESALPFLSLSRDHLCFPPSNWASHARLRGPRADMPRAARPSSTGTLHTSLPPQAPSRLHPLLPAPSGRKQLGAFCFQAAVASDRLLTRPEVGVSGSPFRMRRPPAGTRGHGAPRRPGQPRPPPSVHPCSSP